MQSHVFLLYLFCQFARKKELIVAGNAGWISSPTRREWITRLSTIRLSKNPKLWRAFLLEPRFWLFLFSLAKHLNTSVPIIYNIDKINGNRNKPSFKSNLYYKRLNHGMNSENLNLICFLIHISGDYPGLSDRAISQFHPCCWKIQCQCHTRGLRHEGSQSKSSE